MTPRPLQLEKCRERPQCGTPVVVGERQAHRRWHASMVLGVRHTVVNEGWEPVVYIASFSAAFRDTIFKGQTGRLDAVEKLY